MNPNSALAGLIEVMSPKNFLLSLPPIVPFDFTSFWSVVLQTILFCGADAHSMWKDLVNPVHFFSSLAVQLNLFRLKNVLLSSRTSEIHRKPPGTSASS